MSTVPVRRYTVEEYLELERTSDVKHEYYDGEIFELHRDPGPPPTAGTAFPHHLVALNVAAELRSRLRGGSCRAFAGHMQVLCPTGLRTYPDAGVVCGTPDFEAVAGMETLKNPMLLAEVSSPSTEVRDRDRLFRGYGTIPSLQGYLIVSGFEPRVEHYARHSDGWLMRFARDIDAEVERPELRLSIPLAGIYADVTFPPEVPGRHPGPAKRPRTLPPVNP